MRANLSWITRVNKYPVLFFYCTPCVGRCARRIPGISYLSLLLPKSFVFQQNKVTKALFFPT